MIGIGRYLLGVCLAVGTLGPVLLGARRLRTRALPELSGAAAIVAAAIMVVAMLVVALEVIGVLGLLTAPAALLACAAVGGLVWLVAGRIGVSSSVPAPRPPRPGASSPASSRPAATVALAGVAAVGAAWLGWTIYSYRHGMQTVDTLWYHLPDAARFVQDASITHLHYVDDSGVTAFYPANSELLHALGLLLFGNDLISPVLNLAWAALALVAAWAIGAGRGRGPHCVLAVLLVLATPGLIDTQPGGGLNDIVCIALLLGAVALLVAGGLGGRVSALAAVAAGLAIGTKFTMVIPAVALGLGVVAISPGGGRVRHAGRWAAGLIVLGGYWYLRNAVLAGNPLPAVAIHLGPLSLPAPHVSTPTFTVGQYLFNAHVWGAFYVPGLRRALGPAWWAIGGLAGLGTLGALLAGEDRLQRMLGAVALVCAVGYLLTPQFLGLPGAPIFFVDNVRYAAAPLVLGLVLAPRHRWLGGRRSGAWLLAVLAAILVATEIDPGVWPTGLGLQPFDRPISGGPAVAGALLGVVGFAAGALWIWHAPLRARLAGIRLLRAGSGAAVALTALAAGVVVAGGWGVTSSYASGRYAGAAPFPAIYRWARAQRHARIGIVGFVEQYPLYGAEDSNYVQYIGAAEPHRGFAPISGCAAWREAVDRGRYGWLVIAPLGFEFPNSLTIAPELAWTKSSPAATETISEQPVGGFPGERVVLLRITGRLDPRSCPAPHAHRGAKLSPLGLV